MEDLLDCAVVTLAQLLVELELAHIYLERCAIGKVDTVGM
jgi:hypothetical protein